MNIIKQIIVLALLALPAIAQYPVPGSTGGGGGGGGCTAGTGITCTGSTINVDTAVIESRVNAQSGASLYCATSAGDTYTCSMTPTLTAYTAGMCVVIDPDTTNTGASTLNIDALGAKSILGPTGAALQPGDLMAGKSSLLCYDGVEWLKQGPSFLVQDPTATTGDTKLVVKAGAGQASNLLELQDNAGGVRSKIDSVGDIWAVEADGSTAYVYASDGAGFQISNASGTSASYLAETVNIYASVGVNGPLGINASTVTITDPTATTGATLVSVVAGASQTTKSVVLQTGGRITAPLTTPATSGETCTAGTMTADASYIYICTAANTWKRSALSAF